MTNKEWQNKGIKTCDFFDLLIFRNKYGELTAGTIKSIKHNEGKNYFKTENYAITDDGKIGFFDDSNHFIEEKDMIIIGLWRFNKENCNYESIYFQWREPFNYLIRKENEYSEEHNQIMKERYKRQCSMND